MILHCEAAKWLLKHINGIYTGFVKETLIQIKNHFIKYNKIFLDHLYQYHYSYKKFRIEKFKYLVLIIGFINKDIILV